MEARTRRHQLIECENSPPRHVPYITAPPAMEFGQNVGSENVVQITDEVCFPTVGVVRRNTKACRIFTRLRLVKKNVAFDVNLFAPKMRLVHTLRALIMKIGSKWHGYYSQREMNVFQLTEKDNGDFKVKAFLVWTGFVVTFRFTEVPEEVGGHRGCHVVCYPSKWQVHTNWLKKKVVVVDEEQERSLRRCLGLLKMAIENVDSRTRKSG